MEVLQALSVMHDGLAIIIIASFSAVAIGFSVHRRNTENPKNYTDLELRQAKLDLGYMYLQTPIGTPASTEIVDRLIRIDKEIERRDPNRRLYRTS